MEVSVFPFGDQCSDASGARDPPAWEVGWSITFLTGDAILKERKSRKQVVRKKILQRNEEEDAGAL